MTPPEMTIMGLKILRKLIEFQNKNPKIIKNHKPSYEWESNDYKWYKTAVVER